MSNPASIFPTVQASSKRVDALKDLQVSGARQMLGLEREYQLQKLALHVKYKVDALRPWYDKRAAMINGQCEKTEGERSWDTSQESDDDLGACANRTVTGPAVGLPLFWLRVLENSPLCNEVKEHDKPILKHLSDIKLKWSAADLMHFSVAFVFASNEYFDDTTLTKTYEMRFRSNNQDDTDFFQGIEICGSTGTKIHWKADRNVIDSSFFDLFDPQLNNLMAIEKDFVIGSILRDKIIPLAIYYYTGEEKDDGELSCLSTPVFNTAFLE